MALIVTLGLAGCTTGPIKPAEHPGNQARIREIGHWRLDGRIAVQTPKDAFQANLFWEHELQQDRLRVSGPFSQGVVSIVVQQDVVLIRDASGQSRMSRDVPNALRKELGVAVPISNLRWWVMGVPEPTAPGEPRYDTSGQLSSLRQSGWLIDFERFVPVQGLSLPQKLSARGGDVKIKLFVDDWTLLP